MQNLRRVVQVLSFAAFVYLFVLTIGQYAAGKNILASRAPIDTFFRIDPLLGLTTMLATRRIISVMLIWGLPVVILTLLAGRFFCGWLCPLGTCLDATDTLFFRKRRRISTTTDPRRIKYYILFGVLIAAAVGSQLAYLLDPITILTRAFTFALWPIITLTTRAGISLPYVPSDVEYFFRFNFLAAAILIGILAANAISRRYWCRTLCPLGALLGLLSRFALVRRTVEPTCNTCKRCIPDCKMGAIMPDPTEYRAPECIYCYSCTPVCPTLATRIAPAFCSGGILDPARTDGELDLDRRRVFQAAGLGLIVAALGKTNIADKGSKVGHWKTSSDVLIRPPGAVEEDEFTNRCLRCSECMKVCPTNGLQPALAEAGFEGIWTPVLIPRIGECTMQCNLCSQVCSSQAIQPFEVDEKKHLFIGRAVIDRSQCIAWNSDKECLVCNECCSYQALIWKKVDGVQRPFVEEHKCVGCGICENACPIQPTSAIRVFAFGDRRYQSREEQKMFFDQRPSDEEQQRFRYRGGQSEG